MHISYINSCGIYYPVHLSHTDSQWKLRDSSASNTHSDTIVIPNRITFNVLIGKGAVLHLRFIFPSTRPETASMLNSKEI